jgi:RHS repeat-associated protein
MSSTYWSESFLRPPFVTDEVWQKILSNLLSQIGDPIDDIGTSLQDDFDRLEVLGFTDPSPYLVMTFEAQQAGDFGSIAERNQIGALGQGWSSLSDIRLLISDNGSKSIAGLVDMSALKSLDATKIAQYSVSISLDKVLGQDGKFVDGQFIRPTFSLERPTSGELTLISVSGGFEARANSGDRYLFDEQGKLVTFVSSEGEEISVVYDVNDRIERYENASGDYVEFSYDGNGKIISAEDGNGQIVSYNYTSGRLINIEDDSGETDFTYDGNGNLLTAQRAGGAELEFTYDVQERLASQTVGSLMGETYSYDSAGAITITNALSEETTIQMGPYGATAGITNNLNQSLTFDYDAALRILTVHAADGTESMIRYNEAGLAETIIDSNNSRVGFEYNSSGKIVSFIDGEDGERTFDYDSSGRLVEVEWGDSTTLSYDYDLQGNLVESTNRRGQTVEYDYDGRGRVTEMSGSASGALSYTYDGRGNVITITNPSGITNITYDAGDRVTLIEYPNGRSLEYTYDTEGKRLSMENQDGEATHYTYDAAGRLETVSDENGLLTTYTYDAVGRLETETNTNGTLTEYEYDTAGRLTDITNYDASSNVNSFFEYTYDLVGRKTAVVTEDGSWSYDYDDAGQLIEAIFTSTTVGIPSTSIEYQYDNAGNRIATIENSVTTNYTTNDLNQYTAVGGKALAYDDDGNLITQTQTSNNYSYVYDIDNRLIQVTKPGGVIVSYEYDVFGNRSAIVDNGVRTELLVDPFGNGNVIAEYDSLGARVVTYTYGMGLTSRTDALGVHGFFDTDATGSVIGLTDNSGAIANKYIYTPFGDELYEAETVSNNFEFHGSIGATEDAENLLYMRERSYDVELGRFLSEDPLYLTGDVANLYRFANNDPIQFVDPTGEMSVLALAGLAYNVGVMLPLAVEYFSSSDPDYKRDLVIAAGPYLVSTALGAAVPAGTHSSSMLGDGLFVGGLIMDLWDAAVGDANASDGRGGRDFNGDGRSDSGGNGAPGGGGGGRSGDPGNPSPPGSPPGGSPPGGGDSDGGPAQPPGGGGPGNQGSPLVLDLDGDGIELYKVGDYGTYFDLRGNGQAVRTGWVSPDDALLAYDVNDNGKIDDISELFGSVSTDGFAMLATHDANTDGKIDALDAIFDDLIVWRDTNSDGISQKSEMKTLADHNIISINLNADRLAGEYIGGNLITHEATYTMTGDVERTIVDAWFSYQVTMTRNVEEYTLDLRTVFLPTLRGYGDIKDLHIAASIDNGSGSTTTIQQLISFSSGRNLADSIGDWSGTKSVVETLMLTWAGVEGVGSTGRGNFVNAQHLAFYEAFIGEDFEQYQQPNPLIEAGQFIEAIYQNTVTHSASSLLAQAVGGEIFEAAYFDLYTGGMKGDMTLVQTGIDAIKTEAIASVDAIEVWANFAQFLGYTKGLDNLTVGEISALDTAIAATSIPSIADWDDVVAYMTLNIGPVIREADDWGSFEVYYDNLIQGTSGNDTIIDPSTGGLKSNELRGLNGNDSISGLDGHDKLLGGDGNDTLYGGTGDDYLLGGEGDDIYVYEDGDDTISELGGNGTDELHIAASTGLDETDLVDYYRVENDLMIFLSNGDRITIEDYRNNKIEKIVFDLTSAEIDLTALLEEKFNGSAGRDFLRVEGETYQTLVVNGYAGNDTLEVVTSSAEFHGGDGYDDLIGAGQADELYGDNGDDYLKGNGGNDYLSGGAGNDTLEGGAGDDILVGDAGNDTFIFGEGDGNDYINMSSFGLSAGDKVSFRSNVSTNEIILLRTSANADDITFILSSTSEQLTIEGQYDKLGGITNYMIPKFVFSDGTIWTADDVRLKYITDHTTSGDDTLYGFEWADNYASSAGNDYIVGGNGGDTYNWGAGSGNDTIYDLYNQFYNGDGDAMNFTGLSSADVLFSKSGNDLIITNFVSNETLTFTKHFQSSQYGMESFVFTDQTLTRANVLTLATTGTTINGTSGVNLLNGTTGNDTINGYAGADTIEAYDGNDTVNGGDGNDVINGNIGDDALNGDDGNDIITGGNGIDTIHGGNDNDTISGEASADILYGDAGDDTIYGGVGADTINGDDGADTLYGDDDNDTIYGGNQDDIIYGGSGVDTLYGDAGNDYLDGGSGNDNMTGGVGDDTYVINSTSDVLTELVGEGTDTVVSSVTKTLGNYFENLTLSGTSNNNAIGNALANYLIGNTGNNTLDGSTGDDTMEGKAGNDLYYVESTSDIVIEAINEGTDSVSSSITYTLTDNVENLTLTGSSALNGTGNALNNSITGNSGANTLDGGAGSDTLSGGGGNDTYIVDDVADVTTELSSNGTDLVQSSINWTLSNNIENLTLTGSSNINGSGNNSANTITGNTGDNVLFGAGGTDTLYGGDGNDTLRASDGADTLYGNAGSDIFMFDISNTTSDTIADFSLAQSDKIDVSDLLQGFDPLTDAITDFVQITTSGSNSLLKVDVDGGANNFVQIATITGVTGLTDEAALVTSGNLVVT